MESLSVRPLAHAFVDGDEIDELDDEPAAPRAGQRSRIEELRNLLLVLRAAAADGSRDQFCHAFAEARRVLELEDRELAETFQMSRPTVGRWARGESAPHQVGRKPMLDALARRAQAKLRILAPGTSSSAALA